MRKLRTKENNPKDPQRKLGVFFWKKTKLSWQRLGTNEWTQTPSPVGMKLGWQRLGTNGWTQTPSPVDMNLSWQGLGKTIKSSPLGMNLSWQGLEKTIKSSPVGMNLSWQGLEKTIKSSPVGMNLSWQGLGMFHVEHSFMVGPCQLKFESPVRVKHIIIILIC